MQSFAESAPLFDAMQRLMRPTQAKGEEIRAKRIGVSDMDVSCWILFVLLCEACVEPVLVAFAFLPHIIEEW
jgi:hypothetical protein